METGSDALSLSFNETQLGLNILGNGIMNIMPIMANHAAFTFDYIGITYPTTSTEVYSLLNGGATGSAVKTFTVVYSDAKKYRVSSILMA